ncbi:Rve domain containing hypothetical protein [Phytophthora palmivora]|uniref:Integrase catalytic domain-containing protein n=1 Tax=Phytophthora palmivora TaxID=4796 RepID=A0A2P4YV78_9STRA|nr:Rve domain containing hypothetical protein [Phytophthora palmivora]
MKFASKGLLPQIVKPEYEQLSDRSTAEWKTNDLKSLGVIAGDVSLTYQVYIRGALSAADAWTLLEELFNRKTLKNRLIVTKKLNNFKMEPGTRFANHVDQFKVIVLQMGTIGEPLDETRQLVLLLGSLTDEYKMISTVLENTPNITLAYAIQALSGVTASDESPSAQEKAFAAKKRNPGGKHRFGGKCFYCKKQGHKEFECRKKKSDEERGQPVDSGASSHMASVQNKFVSMKELKTPVRITIADDTKIDAVATGTVSMKLMGGTTVSLLDVLYIPEVEGSLISVSKLAEKNVVVQFSKDKCVFRYGDAKVMEATRCGNVYKLKIVGDEFKRYERLVTMADEVHGVTDGVTSDAICVGCCLCMMRADDFPRYPEKLVKSAGVLDLVHTDVMGPMQTKTPGGWTYVVTFIDDYSRHVTVYFMKAKADVPRRQFKAYPNQCGIQHEKTVPYTPQQYGLTERMTRSLVEMARCMLYHETVGKKSWAEAVNTAAWITNRIPNSVIINTPYEIVYKTKPLLKKLKVFGALGYAHIPDEKRRKLDAKVFKCRFMGYEDGVKGYRVMNVTTGKLQIVRTVSFMETNTSGYLMVRQDEDEEPTTIPVPGKQRSVDTRVVVPSVTEGHDVNPLQRDTEMDSVMKGDVIRHKARLVTKGYLQRHDIEYEEMNAPVAYLNSILTKLAKCCAEGFEIEQCDVDTAFLYGKLEEEIYMELPEGLQELLSLADTEGEVAHLKTMGFIAADTDPCVYTRGEGDSECIVCLYTVTTKDVAITFDGRMGTKLTAYSDADWAGNRDDRLSDIGAEQHGPTVIYEDNHVAMALAKNVGYQIRTKHIDICYHFIREKIASGEVGLTYEEPKNQLAEFLTKGLSTMTLRY